MKNEPLIFRNNGKVKHSISFTLIEFFVAKSGVAMSYIVARAKASLMRIFTLIELLVACKPKLPVRGRRSIQGVFTLIELLVVIAIIAVLASMLLPSLKKARDTAKTISCASQLRQVWLGQHQYTEDTDGWVVPWKYKDENGNWKLWPYFLRNYLDLEYQSGNLPRTILRCPAENNVLSATAPYWTPSSFALNYWCGDPAIPGSQVPRFRLNRLKAPSETSLFADGRPTIIYYSTPSEVEIRHGIGANVAFMDGHVKFWKYLDLQANSNINTSAFMDGIP